MKITKFKTLIYMDNYVDVSKLNSGIYSSIKPTVNQNLIKYCI